MSAYGIILDVFLKQLKMNLVKGVVAPIQPIHLFSGRWEGFTSIYDSCIPQVF